MFSRLVVLSSLVFFLSQFSFSAGVTEENYDAWNATPICSDDAGAFNVCRPHFVKNSLNPNRTKCKEEPLWFEGDSQKKLVASCKTYGGTVLVISKGDSNGGELTWYWTRNVFDVANE